MKKLIYLLLVIPFAMAISSCSSDKDLPNVDITMTFNNAAVADGSVYAVQDSVLQITGITTKTVGSDKASAIVNIDYFWNYIPAPGLTFGSFPLDIDLNQVPLVDKGANILGLNAKLLEVDKSIANCSLRIPIVVVDSVQNLPDGLELGEATLTFTSSQKE